jgi:prophage DNA circulation protein
MAWRDRLREGAITFPNGERFVFEYEDVSKDVSKKTNQYTFGDKEGALVQDFGLGVISFPLTIFFSGADYDITADNFEAAAAFAGTSLLEHPIYGNHDVVLEAYTRTDPLKTAGNQVQFDLVLTETIIEAIPQSAAEGKSLVIAEINELAEIQADAFNVDYDNVSDKLSAKDRILQFTKDFTKGFDEIIKVDQQVNDAINNITGFINAEIDELLGSPAILSATLYSLIRLPGRSVATVQSRVQSYFDTIQAQLTAISGAATDIFNKRTEKQLSTTSLIVAAAEAALFANNDLITKQDATGIASELLSQYRDVQDYLDNEQTAALGDDLETRYSVSDGITQSMKSIISATAGNLVRLSFSLKQERIIQTSQQETIITLCQELYGGKIEDPIVDGSDQSKLDFFISTNQITGDELILIPKEREIRYYI